MINIPNDCVLVKLSDGVCCFMLYTWHIQEGEVKSIPLDIYEACEGLVEVIPEEGDFEITGISENIVEDVADAMKKHKESEKVVKSGKSKRKKH